MAQPHRPRKGSMGYSPRKRANSPIPRVKSWPDAEEVKIQGFAGYKAGMTHGFVIDYRPTSTTSKQEVQIPLTVIETPPMKIGAIRLYEETAYGLKIIKEFWAEKLDKELRKRLTLPKKSNKPNLDELNKIDCDEVRVIAYTQPKLVSGVPKKIPELMELRIGGGTIQQRKDYARNLLGKEIDITNFAKDGEMIDVLAVTKGKGFQGAVQRWGVKLLSHKNSKHRRMEGTQGPWHPSYVMREVPQAGQMGYHNRTEYNKRILKIGNDGKEITPKGGFLHYGTIRNKYIILHGSVPGPSKRLIRLRAPIRLRGVKLEKPPELTYISVESKQGV